MPPKRPALQDRPKCCETDQQGADWPENISLQTQRIDFEKHIQRSWNLIASPATAMVTTRALRSYL
jgi:hypothetical protein